MIAFLVAVVVSGDPYGGFRARLHPFGAESLHSWSVTKLQEDGYDVTSLLYEDRRKLLGILQAAPTPATFDAKDVNLLMRFSQQTWVVDASGTVQGGKKSMRLSKEQFRSLREGIRLAMPRVTTSDE